MDVNLLTHLTRKKASEPPLVILDKKRRFKVVDTKDLSKTFTYIQWAVCPVVADGHSLHELSYLRVLRLTSVCVFMYVRVVGEGMM